MSKTPHGKISHLIIFKKHNESIDSFIRRWKKKLYKTNLKQEIRDKRFFVPANKKRKIKSERAKYNRRK